MKYPILFILISTFNAYANTLKETTLWADVKFQKVSGKQKKMAPVKIKVKHFSEADFFPLNREAFELSQECRLQLKGGLFAAIAMINPQEFRCLNDEKLIAVSEEMLETMIFSSLNMSIFPPQREKVFALMESKRIEKTDKDSGVLSAVGRAIQNFFHRGTSIYFISSQQETSFIFKSDRLSETITVSIRPTKVKMIDSGSF